MAAVVVSGAAVLEVEAVAAVEDSVERRQCPRSLVSLASVGMAAEEALVWCEENLVGAVEAMEVHRP